LVAGRAVAAVNRPALRIFMFWGQVCAQPGLTFAKLSSYQKTRVSWLFDAVDTSVGINGPETELALPESP
jgi:hypothetical protein